MDVDSDVEVISAPRRASSPFASILKVAKNVVSTISQAGQSIGRAVSPEPFKVITSTHTVAAGGSSSSTRSFTSSTSTSVASSTKSSSSSPYDAASSTGHRRPVVPLDEMVSNYLAQFPGGDFQGTLVRIVESVKAIAKDSTAILVPIGHCAPAVNKRRHPKQGLSDKVIEATAPAVARIGVHYLPIIDGRHIHTKRHHPQRKGVVRVVSPSPFPPPPPPLPARARATAAPQSCRIEQHFGSAAGTRTSLVNHLEPTASTSFVYTPATP